MGKVLYVVMTIVIIIAIFFLMGCKVNCKNEPFDTQDCTLLGYPPGPCPWTKCCDSCTEKYALCKKNGGNEKSCAFSNDLCDFGCFAPDNNCKLR